jgi:hypothetical protein
LIQNFHLKKIYICNNNETTPNKKMVRDESQLSPDIPDAERVARRKGHRLDIVHTVVSTLVSLGTSKPIFYYSHFVLAMVGVLVAYPLPLTLVYFSFS